MGWFHDLGNKISGEIHSIGTKIHNAGNKAAKFVHKVAPTIKKVAQDVSGVAGKVASVTEAALPFVKEISAELRPELCRYLVGWRVLLVWRIN